MKQLAVFAKKEWMEQVRTGRLWLLLILFVLFGVMSPALAKMTPWMFEMMGDTLKEQGISIEKIEVTAFTSWHRNCRKVDHSGGSLEHLLRTGLWDYVGIHGILLG